MKIKFATKAGPKQVSPVKIGNVYVNNQVPAFPLYRVVIGLATGEYRRKRNGVVCVHVDAAGVVQGASNNPYDYVEGCWDLVGKCQQMPTIKIEFLPGQSPRKINK